MGKEFEKWINYNWDTLSNISPYPYSNLLSEGWKAALEWALNALWVEYGDTDLNTTWYGGPIEKELEDK